MMNATCNSCLTENQDRQGSFLQSNCIVQVVVSDIDVRIAFRLTWVIAVLRSVNTLGFEEMGRSDFVERRRKRG